MIFKYTKYLKLINFIIFSFLSINKGISQSNIEVQDTTSEISIPVILDNSEKTIKNFSTPLDRNGVLSNFYLTDSQIIFSVYQNIKDLLLYFPGVFIYDLGSPGQNDGLKINFSDARSISILNNTISTNEIFSGTINLNNYPVESLEKIEFIGGTKAFLYGFNSVNGVINLKTKFYNSPKPFTKIRYSESAYEETSLDGIFSQNILSNLNTTLGFRREATDGRFANNNYDSWNIRFLSTYSINKKITLFLNNIYNQRQTNVNHGIDFENTPSNDLYDRLKTKVIFPDAYQFTTRNDIQLAMSSNFFEKAMSTNSIILYLTDQMYTYKNQMTTSVSQLNFYKLHTRWMGLKIFQDFKFLKIDTTFSELKIGAELRFSQILQSAFRAYYKAYQNNFTADFVTRPLNFVLLNIYSKYQMANQNKLIDIGGDFQIFPVKNLYLKLGYATVHRFLYEFEIIFSQPNTLTRDYELYRISEFSVNYTPFYKTTLSFSLINKDVKNSVHILPINRDEFNFKIQEKYNQKLLNISLLTEIWKFESRINYSQLLHEKYPELNQIHPTNNLSSEITYSDYFWNKKLLLKIGLKGKYISEQWGYYYNPAYDIFIPNKTIKLGSNKFLDAILIAQIGDAVLHIALENLFNQKGAITYFYPLKDRSLRIGVNWRFEN